MACMQPGVAIAAVASHYRMNANLLLRWVASQEELDAAAQARESTIVPTAEFVVYVELDIYATTGCSPAASCRSASSSRDETDPFCPPQRAWRMRVSQGHPGKLPSQPVNHIAKSLPHRWVPA
jgi:transposase-like protein